MIDIERTAEEMEAIVQRLQDQLRRLEAETDAQIQSRLSEIRSAATTSTRWRWTATPPCSS